MIYRWNIDRAITFNEYDQYGCYNVGTLEEIHQRRVKEGRFFHPASNWRPSSDYYAE